MFCKGLNVCRFPHMSVCIMRKSLLPTVIPEVKLSTRLILFVLNYLLFEVFMGAGILFTQIITQNGEILTCSFLSCLSLCYHHSLHFHIFYLTII